jgi:hypothetical protein
MTFAAQTKQVSETAPAQPAAADKQSKSADVRAAQEGDIAGCYSFLAQKANIEIDAAKSLVLQENEPSLAQEIAAAVATATFVGGAAGFAEFIAHRFVKDEIVREVVKSTFESGLDEGKPAVVEQFADPRGAAGRHVAARYLPRRLGELSRAEQLRQR